MVIVTGSDSVRGADVVAQAPEPVASARLQVYTKETSFLATKLGEFWVL